MKRRTVISVALAVVLIVALTLVGQRQCGPPAAQAAVRINEVMFNPFGEDAGAEWVELYNADLREQNTRGWLVSNRNGVVATLPDWALPSNCYLVVVFGAGIDDSDFGDGRGVFYTQSQSEVLDNAQDEVGLYRGAARASSIIDFVCWSTEGDYMPGEAYRHAVRAKQWSEGSFLDLGFPSGKSMVGGFSIGRDKDSSDTDSPDDWDRNGGRNAYFATAGLRNAGPYFTVDWGIKLVQTKVNMFLIERGHQVIHASHEIIAESQTDDETYVRAKHSFTTSYAGYEDTFAGIGEYRWTRVNPGLWSDEIEIELAGSSGDEWHSINFSRQYQDSGLTQVITESFDGVHSFEVFDNEEVLPDVVIGPTPTAPTHRQQRGIFDVSTTTITQTGLDQYRVETTSAKDLAYRNEKQELSFVKTYQILSDDRIEASAELTITSDVREALDISMAYSMDTDVGWHEAHDLGNMDVVYSVYDLRVGEQSYSLVEPGYFRMTRQADRDYYDVDCLLLLGGPGSFEIGCYGYIERVLEAGEVIYRGEIADVAGVSSWRFYIDGWEAAVGGGVCAIAGGLIGLLWVGVGSVIGAGAGGAACGAVGAAIEAATEPDTTKPTIEWEILDSGSDKDKGWLRVKVTVSDDTRVADWGVTAKNQEGQTLTNRSYQPDAKSESKTFPLHNKNCAPRFITITVSATDSSGNVMRDSRQFNVPARICVPNIEKTEPAKGDVGVPVRSDVTITFCKPMDTAAAAAALSISPAVGFTINWSEYNTVATLVLAAPMAYGTTYTVVISTGALSYAGYALEEPYEFSFRTDSQAQPPVVVGTLPPHNAQEFNPEAEVHVIFSQPMNAAATAQAIVIVPATEYEIGWHEDKRLMIIYPAVAWQTGTAYQIVITDQAMSADGMNMEEDYVFGFVTAE
jgi:hypothetical protein